MPLLNENERLEDLDLKQLRIIQNEKTFCFGIDAVLLAWYASGSVKPRSRIADLGTGNGIIPLLLYGRTGASSIDALEIQKEMADLAKRNVELNHLEEKIHIHHCDLRDSKSLFPSSFLDIITCNPPYMPVSRGMKSPSETLAIARHEITCTIDDISDFARMHLKDRGKLFIVHRADRIHDIAASFREKSLEIKRLRFIYPYPGKNANLLLLEAVKKSNPSCIVEPPLYVYNTDGTYSDTINAIYGTETPKSKDFQFG